MHTAVAEMIVMIARFVMIVIIRVNRAMYLAPAIVGIDRQGIECIRNAFQSGKYKSGKDGKNDGSVHRAR